jgi:hypothetical protein
MPFGPQVPGDRRYPEVYRKFGAKLTLNWHISIISPMPERMKAPFKYINIENPGEYCLAHVGKELNPMQRLSSEALKENGFFKTLPPENQEIALQTLSILGTHTLIICEGRWNSNTWRDAWKMLMKFDKPLINSAIAATGQPTIESGFKNLYHMLDTGVGVKTMEDLRRVIAVGRQELPIAPISPTAVINNGVKNLRN